MNKAFLREPDRTADYCPRCGQGQVAGGSLPPTRRQRPAVYPLRAEVLPAVPESKAVKRFPKTRPAEAAKEARLFRKSRASRRAGCLLDGFAYRERLGHQL